MNLLGLDRRLFAACAALLLATACDEQQQPSPRDDREEQPALPEALRVRALEHAREARSREVAPEWGNPSIGRVRPLYRPDIDGPAFFEVTMENGGQPAGYIVLSTGEHDYPIVHWNSRGTPPTERLARTAAEEGRSIARYYRLDIDYLGEDEDGEIAASDKGFFAPIELRPPAPDSPAAKSGAPHEVALGKPYATWAEAKARYAEGQRPYLEALRASARTSWDPPKPSSSAVLGAVSSSTYCEVTDPGSLAPNYAQLQPYEPPSGRWWSSGCAGTAWAMMIGWADIRASNGDPKWKTFGGLYREAVSPYLGAPDAVAPLGFSWGAKVMTDKIAVFLGTTPVAIVGSPSQGMTPPGNMSKINDYLAYVGMGGSVLAETFDWGGGQFDALRDRATRHICTNQSPAVMGVGALHHYAMATRWILFGSTQYFWLTMGWARADQNQLPVSDMDGWQTPGVFFAGTLVPRTAGPQVMPRRGMEILSARYGSSCSSGSEPSFWDNAAAHVSAACNDTASCDYFVNHGVLGDPAPGCAKDFSVDFKCSDAATPTNVTVSPEASGRVAALRCPTIVIQSATYGGNCGAPQGNENFWSAFQCNGATQCRLEVDYRVLGDPVPGCAKDFVVKYQCNGGPLKTLTAPPEAGYGSVLKLSCP